MFFLSIIEDDFKSDVDLRVACLILDKQVKLINGNEANILIPHDWKRKYMEDRNQIMALQETEIKQKSSTHSINFPFEIYFFVINCFPPEDPVTLNISTIPPPEPRILPKTGIKIIK